MKDFIIPWTDRDMGTPAKEGAPVTLTIDGFEVTVPAGTSVFRAAAEAGIAVPKLCATDSLEAFGSCRLCVVEIEGRRGTPASCTTPVAPGMVVHTQSAKIRKIRKGVMELYISDHPLDCLTCAANGDCELQDMAGAVGLRDVRYEPGVNHFAQRSATGPNPQYIPKDDSNPYFTYDPAKCIVCSRCVRACEEVQGTFALTIEGRGFDSRVSFGAKTDDALSSDCVSCGACVQACPTATLQEKSVIELGTPTRSVVTTCAYCGVGCSFKAELNGDQLVRMVPWKHGKANRGHSCVKGRFAYGYATHSDRILNPMIRDTIDQPWREVSWDEAITFAATRLRALQEKHGRKSIGVITSSRCTNEETYLVQKLARAVFHNNNTDTCARVCHSPTGYGLGQTFGTSAGTQDFDSVEHTDVVVIIGANPTDGHPVFASRLKKRLRAGAKLIVIDPRRIDLVKSPHIEAAHHLPLRPGTNVAVVGRHGPRHRHRRADGRGLHPGTLRLGRVLRIRRVRRRPAPLARSHRTPHRRPRRRPPRRRAPLRHRRQRRHLLRPRRDRAQPRLHHRHRHREPRHAHRQHRPQGRGREPAPRPEQRAGLLRHGVASRTNSPATATSRTPTSAPCSKTSGAWNSTPNRASASPTCSTPPSKAPSRASTARARTSSSPTPTRTTWPPASPRWNA